MLNRNRLFGKQDEKLVEKTHKGLGVGAYPAASTDHRPSPPAESPPAPGAMKAAHEGAPAAASSAARSPEEVQGSKLIVGPNIKLKGVEITDCDTLVVEGHVEATMDSRSIQIAAPGTFIGTVGIDVAEIRGKFSGELTARKRLVVYATGRVSGKIHYGKLVIEEGGELSGEIKALGALTQDQAGTQAGRAAVPRTIAAPPPELPH